MGSDKSRASVLVNKLRQAVKKHKTKDNLVIGLLDIATQTGEDIALVIDVYQRCFFDRGTSKIDLSDVDISEELDVEIPNDLDTFKEVDPLDKLAATLSEKLGETGLFPASIDSLLDSCGFSELRSGGKSGSVNPDAFYVPAIVNDLIEGLGKKMAELMADYTQDILCAIKSKDCGVKKHGDTIRGSFLIVIDTPADVLMKKTLIIRDHTGLFEIRPSDLKQIKGKLWHVDGEVLRGYKMEKMK